MKIACCRVNFCFIKTDSDNDRLNNVIFFGDTFNMIMPKVSVSPLYYVEGDGIVKLFKEINFVNRQ